MDNIQQNREKGDLLIVLGDPSERQALEALLTEEGYRVRCAADGLSALTLSGAEKPPELILIDIWLPDANGYDVCCRVKEDPKTFPIFVIFISGVDDPADKLKGYSSWGSDFITKPFEPESLLTCVATTLFRQRRLKQLRIDNEKQKTTEAEYGPMENKEPASFAQSMDERLRLERLLFDVSTQFINLPVDQIDNTFIAVLRRICKSLELDLASVWQFPKNQKFMLMTHPYIPYGTLPLNKPFDSKSVYPWTHEQMMAGKIVPISSMNKLPAEAAIDKETFLYQNIKSVLAIPLSINGEPPFGVLLLFEPGSGSTLRGECESIGPPG